MITLSALQSASKTISVASRLLVPSMFAAIPLFVAFPQPAAAEVTSGQCPYSCDTENISRNHCKDWKENGKCYVEDLRPDSRAALGKISSDDSLKRDVRMVEKTLEAGEETTVELHDRPISRVDVVAKRIGSDTETKLNLTLEDSKQEFGPAQQVDRNETHTLRYSGERTSPKGQELVLSAENGDVYVEYVHVLYEK